MPHLAATGSVRTEANDLVEFSARDGKVVLSVTPAGTYARFQLIIPRAEWEHADWGWRSAHESAEEQQGYIDEGDL